jgi:hypothetical protein
VTVSLKYKMMRNILPAGRGGFISTVFMLKNNKNGVFSKKYKNALPNKILILFYGSLNLNFLKEIQAVISVCHKWNGRKWLYSASHSCDTSNYVLGMTMTNLCN